MLLTWIQPNGIDSWNTWQVKNLAPEVNMKKLALLITMLFVMNGCNRDLSPLNTAVTSYAPTPTMVAGCPPPFNPNMYCDFEIDPSSGFWWPGGPSPMSNTWSNDTAHSCYRSWKIDAHAAVGYGHWNGLGMSPDKSFPTATKYSMWYKCNSSFSTTWYWVEGSSAGADGESWQTTISFIGDNAWHQFVLNLGAFTSGGGNNHPDPQDVAYVWSYNNAPYGAYVMYIDDIEFLP